MDSLTDPAFIVAIGGLITTIVGIFEGHRRGKKRPCPECGGPKCRRRHTSDRTPDHVSTR